jgi:hypothetical protein
MLEGKSAYRRPIWKNVLIARAAAIVATFHPFDHRA